MMLHRAVFIPKQLGATMKFCHQTQTGLIDESGLVEGEEKSAWESTRAPTRDPRPRSNISGGLESQTAARSQIIQVASNHLPFNTT
jgi:hypothetical protein